MTRIEQRLLTAASVLVLALGACAEQDVPEPFLRQVCLAESVDECIDHAWAGSRPELWLLGEGFQPAFDVDLGQSGGVVVRGSFSASIAGHDMGELWLEDGEIMSWQALSARLPGDVALGRQTVELLTPAGQRAVLEDAFGILDPLRISVSVDQPRVPLGSVARLRIDLENLSPALISDVTLAITAAGDGRCELPETLTPFGMAGGEEVEMVFDLTGLAAGPIELSVSASGLAGGQVPIGPAQPLPAAFSVLSQASLEVQASISPAPARVGDTVDLSVLVTNTGQTPARDVRLLDPLAEGDGKIDWSQEVSEPQDIPAGASRNFHQRGQAARAGSLGVRANATGTESISDRPLGSVSSATAWLNILASD